VCSLRKKTTSIILGPMSKIQAKAPLFCIFIFFGATRAYSNITSPCRELVLNQHYSLKDFPQSEAWGLRTGRESIYADFAMTMVSRAMESFLSKKPPFIIFSDLAHLRRILAKRMEPFAFDSHILAFGYLRWTPLSNQTTSRVDAMAGYSELARLDDGDDSYFRNGELSKRIRDRFREIIKEHGTSSLDTKTRQPLQDEYAAHRKWIFQRRNYIHTAAGELPGSELYVLNVEIPGREMPIELLVVFHPRPDESHDLMDDVFRITTQFEDTKNHVDFMRLIFAMLNATPMHRGSALVAKIYSMAVYAHIFGTPMPAIPDGFDAFSMLEPNFETFDQRYRSLFFPSSNEM
jgi:hypothetical protein